MSVRSLHKPVHLFRYCAGLVLCLPIFCFFIYPKVIYYSYSPKVGDVIFQSLNRSSDLVRAIEGVTGSQISHCGILVEKNNSWYVNEAYGPVHSTPLSKWIERGRGYWFSVYRLKAEYKNVIPQVVSELEKYQGKPYDSRYRLDDEKIYCSELVFKAFRDATDENLGQLEELGQLNWKPYKTTIEKYENGPVPLDRKMITPLGLSQSEKLNHVISLGIPGL